MPGSQANTPDVPDDREAWLLAAAWGSYVHAGDEGACLYGFRAGGSPPQSPAHRDACLAHVGENLIPRARRSVADADGREFQAGAERRDLTNLERLRAWLSSWTDDDCTAEHDGVVVRDQP